MYNIHLYKQNPGKLQMCRWPARPVQALLTDSVLQCSQLYCIYLLKINKQFEKKMCCCLQLFFTEQKICEKCKDAFFAKTKLLEVLLQTEIQQISFRFILSTVLKDRRKIYASKVSNNFISKTNIYIHTVLYCTVYTYRLYISYWFPNAKHTLFFSPNISISSSSSISFCPSLAFPYFLSSSTVSLCTRGNYLRQDYNQSFLSSFCRLVYVFFFYLLRPIVRFFSFFILQWAPDIQRANKVQRVAVFSMKK